MAKGAVTKVGTGGMETKIAAANIVTDAGADMVIVNSNNLNNVNKVVAGEEIGTATVRVTPLSSRRRSFNTGKIIVNIILSVFPLLLLHNAVS